MPLQFPDGVYDRTHTWDNSTDRGSWERTISQDPVETAKILAALHTGDPSTSNEEIRAAMTVQGVPPTQGYDRTPLTVDDMFGGQLDSHLDDFAPSNFSGRKGEFQGSSLPSMPSW